MIEEAIRAIVRNEIETIFHCKVKPTTGSGPQLREAVQAIQERAETPPEPAPGSDAEHPPVGYRLAKVGGKREPGYVFWNGEKWVEGGSALFGRPVDSLYSSPCANPIPANEGDSRAAESVAVPVGWVEVGPGVFRAHENIWIKPDPSIPWGEGYEAILPSEAGEDDHYLLQNAGRWWKSGGDSCHPKDPSAFAWRRKVQPGARSSWECSATLQDGA